MDFLPPKGKPPVMPEWATYIPTRTTKGAFAVHKIRGHALNAIKGVANGILYKLIDGEWSEVCRFENFKKSDTCELCGGNLVKTHKSYYGGEYSYNNGELKWVFEPQIKLITTCHWGKCPPKDPD